jgi:hypothetical protein
MTEQERNQLLRERLDAMQTATQPSNPCEDGDHDYLLYDGAYKCRYCGRLMATPDRTHYEYIQISMGQLLEIQKMISDRNAALKMALGTLKMAAEFAENSYSGEWQGSSPRL